MTRTELSQIGEFGLIDRIKSKNKFSNPNTLYAIGDDAAVLDNADGMVRLVSTDLLLEKIHFDLAYMPLKHLGYKAVAVNISDIAAMNGIPEQITVGLALSNRFSVEAIDELYEGIFMACEHYKVDLVGGDTTSSASGLVISITVIGKAKKDQVVYRNTAKQGDIVCVTGDLGSAYVGLQVLEREKQEFLVNKEMQPQLDSFEYVISRQLRPKARMDVIYELAELGILPTSMIDISDGLASEILHIATQSALGAVIYEDKLPIDKQTYDICINDFKLSPLTCAMNGGEDYELLFTIDQNDYEKLKLHDDISFIGFMQPTEKGVNLISRQKQIVPIQAQGWKSF